MLQFTIILVAQYSKSFLQFKRPVPPVRFRPWSYVLVIRVQFHQLDSTLGVVCSLLGTHDPFTVIGFCVPSVTLKSFLAHEQAV